MAQPTATGTRVNAALARFTSNVIDLDVKILGAQIMRLIKDVGQLDVVLIGDLKVFGKSGQEPPADVTEAMTYGTKFFDAVYYFALEQQVRPTVVAGVDESAKLEETVMRTKRRLLWTAIFLMLRGSYPESAGMQPGTDIPAFLLNICGMDESPLNCATGLASFGLKSISPTWIREIKWNTFAAPIRQRLALGLAGYRSMAPFKLYSCKQGVDQEVRDAYEWVKRASQLPPDYAILSCTRSAAMIGRLGSWNKALANLTLECFTREQIEEMESIKILFAIPTRDPRADTWKAWVSGGDLQLTDPIGL